jgi:hypothetical protein
MSRHAIDALRANSALSTPQQVAAFEAALGEVSRPSGAHELAELHLVLTDATANPEVMFGLIHLLETFDARTQLEAMVAVLPRLAAQAPEWTRTLHFRILNDGAAREIYRDVLKANGAGAQAARRVLREIARHEEAPLKEAALAVLAP